LIGDASLLGQTNSYDLIIEVQDSNTGIVFGEVLLDTFTVLWDSSPCDPSTTTMDPFSIADISQSYLVSSTINLVVPSDTLATSRSDPTYCGQRTVSALDLDTNTPMPSYLTQVPSGPVNSGDVLAI
jgi:hypothetical protein